MLVMLPTWSAVSVEAAGSVFPVVVRDGSCQDVGSDQVEQTSDCDPDAPTWIQDSTQTQQVIVSENIDAPRSISSASQDQNAPVTQVP